MGKRFDTRSGPVIETPHSAIARFSSLNPMTTANTINLEDSQVLPSWSQSRGQSGAPVFFQAVVCYVTKEV